MTFISFAKQLQLLIYFMRSSDKKGVIQCFEEVNEEISFCLLLISTLLTYQDKKLFAATKKMKMAELKRLEEEEARKRAEESKVSKKFGLILIV